MITDAAVETAIAKEKRRLSRERARRQAESKRQARWRHVPPEAPRRLTAGPYEGPKRSGPRSLACSSQVAGPSPKRGRARVD